jgi:hypothetical protein
VDAPPVVLGKVLFVDSSPCGSLELRGVQPGREDVVEAGRAKMVAEGVALVSVRELR